MLFCLAKRKFYIGVVTESSIRKIYLIKMAEEEDKPSITDKLDKYYKKEAIISSIVNKRDRAHAHAIDAGLSIDDIADNLENLVERDENQKIKKVHYKKIDKMVEAMRDKYLEHAKKELGIDIDKMEFASDEEKEHYVDMILQDYAGITTDILRKSFYRAAERDNLLTLSRGKFHEMHGKQHTEAIAQKLYHNASAHIGEDDAEGILEHLIKDKGQEAVKDIKARHKNKANALNLLQKYRHDGAIGEDYVKDYVPVEEQQQQKH